jgi:hypothetical protein
MRSILQPMVISMNKFDSEFPALAAEFAALNKYLGPMELREVLEWIFHYRQNYATDVLREADRYADIVGIR